MNPFASGREPAVPIPGQRAKIYKAFERVDAEIVAEIVCRRKHKERIGQVLRHPDLGLVVIAHARSKENDWFRDLMPGDMRLWTEAAFVLDASAPAQLPIWCPSHSVLMLMTGDVVRNTRKNRNTFV